MAIGRVGRVLSANCLTDLLDRVAPMSPTENGDRWSNNLLLKRATFGLTGLLGHRIICGARLCLVNPLPPAKQPVISRVR
jgi:hypothetical protein